MNSIMNVAANVLFSFLTVSVMGALLGFALAFAARVFSVRKNERIDLLEAALPGLNCGGCGYPGCPAFAQALDGGAVDFALCTPGGPPVAAKIAGILGGDPAAVKERMVTQVHCRGGRATARYKFTYQGLADCSAAQLLFGGDKFCRWTCLGLGSCIKACPVRAINHDADGLVWVNKDLCTGCGACVDVCPTGVMRRVPYTADFIVACNSTDPGSETRGYCSVGCIACRLCERKCPDGGFSVENNLSRISYHATGRRAPAAKSCPSRCILRNTTGRPASPAAAARGETVAAG
jgi:Na+-translocating ferredoxin:NAD+ oxidoreductase subunit B